MEFIHRAERGILPAALRAVMWEGTSRPVERRRSKLADREIQERDRPDEVDETRRVGQVQRATPFCLKLPLRALAD